MDREAATLESAAHAKADSAKRDVLAEALTPVRDAYRRIPHMRTSDRSAFIASVIEFLTR